MVRLIQKKTKRFFLNPSFCLFELMNPFILQMFSYWHICPRLRRQNSRPSSTTLLETDIKKRVYFYSSVSYQLCSYYIQCSKCSWITWHISFNITPKAVFVFWIQSINKSLAGDNWWTRLRREEVRRTHLQGGDDFIGPCYTWLPVGCRILRC